MKIHCKLYSMLFVLFNFSIMFITTKAQSNQVTPKEQSTEVIEVTNNHNFSSLNYQVLRREEFIDSAQTLSDALRNINGIQIRQISGLGNPVSISIRGSSSKQVQMYIDGMLVNDSQFGGFDLNQIPTEQIESIEISKNQALGTGSTPIGGVIRINTYNPTENKKKITLATGSFGYKEISLLSNSAFDTHSIALGGSYVSSDNDYDYLVPQSFNNPSESIEEPLKNNAFDKLSMFINDNAQLGQHQLRLNLQYNQQKKELANYQNNSPENTSNINSDQIRYGVQHYWLAAQTYFDSLEFEGIEVDYTGEHKDELYKDSPTENRINTSEYHTTKQHVGIKPNFNWNTLSFTPFIDINKQTFKSYSERNGEAYQCNGISACDTKAEQTKLTAGARLEWQSSQLPLSSYYLGSKLREQNENTPINTSDEQKQQSNASYSTNELGLNYAINNLNASFNVSRGIRTPTLFELFGDRGSFKGNDNLLPEKASTVTLGAQYQVHKINLSSSLYRQDLNNSIVAIFNSSGVGTYTNVGSALVQGFEFQGDASLPFGFSFSMNMSVIDSNTSSEYVAFDNKKLPGIYHQQFSMSLLYQLAQNWRVKINSSVDKDLYFNRSNKFQSNSNQVGGGNPANRHLTDLSVRWQKPKYSATLSLNNLFNDRYQDLANRPAQGRSIQLKFSIKDI